MRKKILISLLMVSFSSVVMAASEPFGGFYGSLDAGWMNADVNLMKVSASQYGVTGQFSQEITNPSAWSATRNSFTGGLGLGYAKVINQRGVLGLEGRVNFEDLDVTYSKILSNNSNALAISSQATEKLSRDFSLLFKLGVTLDANVLLYGLIGPSWGYFDQSSSFGFMQTQDFGAGETTVKGVVKGAESGYITGWVAGLGMEYLLTRHVSLSLEYTHADYGNLGFPKNLTAPMVVTPPSSSLMGDVEDDNENSATTNNVVLRLTYYIA